MSDLRLQVCMELLYGRLQSLSLYESKLLHVLLCWFKSSSNFLITLPVSEVVLSKLEELISTFGSELPIYIVESSAQLEFLQYIFAADQRLNAYKSLACGIVIEQFSANIYIDTKVIIFGSCLS